MSPRVRWRVYDRDGFIVLQLIARSTNVRQVLALRRIDQRLTSRIDVSVDRHIGVIEPERDQISPHDPVDDCARLYQIWNARTNIGVEIIWPDDASPDRLLQPFRQCHLSRSEHRRDRQLAPITVLLPQPAEISRADAIEHTRHGQRPPPPIVFAHKSATERHTFCRRFRFPFFEKVQHLDHSAPDEPRALIGYPKSTRPRPAFE